MMSIVALALAVSSISVTLTKSGIFERLRREIDLRSDFLGELVHCPYCTSHWLAFGAVAVYQPRVVESAVWPLDYALSAFMVITLASFFSGLIIRAFE